VTELSARIAEIITPSVEALGYDVVRVLFSGSKYPVLQVMAEHKETGKMGVEDCEKVSRVISAVLDVEDPIKTKYSLEVSSPGLDRPLIRLSDYERWAGHKAKVELKMPIEGRRRFSGIVRGAHSDRIRLEVDGKVEELPFADIEKAKLELTDELIKSVQNKQ